MAKRPAVNLKNNLVSIPTHKGIAPEKAGNIPLENATIYKRLVKRI